MQIYIMRHGDAANIAGCDSLRPLTKQGIQETRKMGQWLASRKLTFQHVFVSPYVRAQQSWISVSEALQDTLIQNDVIAETLDFITPSGNANQTHDFLDGIMQQGNCQNEDECYNDSSAILIVSHMPFVSYLVGKLTGTTDMPIFSTGEVAIVNYDIKQMKGQLLEMMSPVKVQYSN